jgi:hypothetical protein
LRPSIYRIDFQAFSYQKQTHLSMLVTRQCDTGRNTWSSSKLEAIYHNSASPRMSNFEPLPTQPDWREQYSAFPLPGENGLLQPSFEQGTTSNVSESNQNQQQSSTRPALEHRHSLGPLRQEASQPASAIDRPDSAPGDCGHQANPIRDDSLVSTESTALSLASLGSNPLSSASSAPAQQGTLANNEGGGGGPQGEIKDEEDDDEDDDEMLDAEEGAPPQTAAERRAERRKMKRFRYGTLPEAHSQGHSAME